MAIMTCFLCANISSCGFKPLLSSNSFAKENLSAIAISTENSIEAAELNHYLYTLLPKSGVDKYKLNIYVSSNVAPDIIQKNSNIVSENVNQIISYNLIDINSGLTLVADQFTQSASYNSTYDPYRSSTELEYTKINLAKYGAEEIRKRLILYFITVRTEVN